MKNFLKVVCFLLVLGVIITLCYFFGGIKADINIPEGKYYLEKTAILIDNEVKSEEAYTSHNLYLETFEGKKIKSFSGDVAFVQSDLVYSYNIVGTGLNISYDGIQKYTGYFAEKLIIIEFTEKFTEDEKEKTKSFRYYYYLDENA